MRVVKKSTRLVFLVATVLPSITRADNPQHGSIIIGEPIARGQFATLQEPSGITALDEQTLMVVEDEATRALKRLTFSFDEASNFNFQEFDQPPNQGFIQRQRLLPLDDLEGIARVSSTAFIVIGSHENASRGERPDREKLLLLTRDGDDIISSSMRVDLFDQLIKYYPELAERVDGSKKGGKRALNIEAIAFDRTRQLLHIGLRAPLMNNKAIIISLSNAVDYLHGTDPVFSEKLHLVDLNKGGVRAMAYDDRSDTLLIVGKQNSGGNKRSTLWALAASMRTAATRYDSDDQDLFENVEGLTPIAERILFVRDKGGKSTTTGDQWFFLKRSQLGLDD